MDQRLVTLPIILIKSKRLNYFKYGNLNRGAAKKN
jgi:hypothetical protein